MDKYIPWVLFVTLTLSLSGLVVMQMHGENFSENIETSNNPEVSIFSYEYSEFGELYDEYIDLTYNPSSEQLNVSLTGRIAITGEISSIETLLYIRAVQSHEFVNLENDQVDDIIMIEELSSGNQTVNFFILQHLTNLSIDLVDRIVVSLSLKIHTTDATEFSLFLSGSTDVYKTNLIHITTIIAAVLSLIIVVTLWSKPNSFSASTLTFSFSITSHTIAAAVILSQGNWEGYEPIGFAPYFAIILGFLAIPIIFDLKLSREFRDKVETKTEKGMTIMSLVRNRLLTFISKRLIASFVLVFLMWYLLFSDNRILLLTITYIFSIAFYRAVDQIKL